MSSYQVTRKRIENEFKRINQRFFNSELQLPHDIDIEFMDTELAAYIPFDQDNNRETLYFTDVFSDKKEFQNTVAHEMIHMWQWQVQRNSSCGHDAVFKYWTRVFDQHGYCVNQVT